MPLLYRSIYSLLLLFCLQFKCFSLGMCMFCVIPQFSIRFNSIKITSNPILFDWTTRFLHVIFFFFSLSSCLYFSLLLLLSTSYCFPLLATPLIAFPKAPSCVFPTSTFQRTQNSHSLQKHTEKPKKSQRIRKKAKQWLNIPSTSTEFYVFSSFHLFLLSSFFTFFLLVFSYFITCMSFIIRLMLSISYSTKLFQFLSHLISFQLFSASFFLFCYLYVVCSNNVHSHLYWLWFLIRLRHFFVLVHCLLCRLTVVDDNFSLPTLKFSSIYFYYLFWANVPHSSPLILSSPLTPSRISHLPLFCSPLPAFFGLPAHLAPPALWTFLRRRISVG